MKATVWEKYFNLINWDGFGFTELEIAKFHKDFDIFFKSLTLEEQIVVVGLMAVPHLLHKLIKTSFKILIKVIKRIVKFAKWSIVKFKELLRKFRAAQERRKQKQYAKQYAQLFIEASNDAYSYLYTTT
jgi:hypothetical protein